MAIGRPISLTPNVNSKNISAIATASQTTFTVAGGYRINNIVVSRNGVRLSQSSDYLANDGSTVVLLSPATVGDVVAFEIFDTHPLTDSINANDDAQTIDGDLTISGKLDVLSGAEGYSAFIGIQSGGEHIGVAKTLNFVGSGNTFAVDGNTIDVTISGSGGGGLGVSVDDTDGIFSYINKYATVTADIVLDTSNAGTTTSIVITTNPVIEVETGVAVTVGAGKTLVIDVLQIKDLYDT
tara:strand:- start:271 stop:987 length:717 start_codon:yes stop_codon:yes gene_type:complete